MPNRGFKFSEESKMKMRLSHLGKHYKPCPEYQKERISQANSANKNSQWKGDKVGYAGIHAYIKRHFPKPEICTKCQEKKTLDLTNKSGKYLRDLNDWEYLCRRCHMVSDGRLERLNPK